MSTYLTTLAVATCAALALLKVADLLIARSMRRSARRIEDAFASLQRAVHKSQQ